MSAYCNNNDTMRAHCVKCGGRTWHSKKGSGSPRRCLDCGDDYRPRRECRKVEAVRCTSGGREWRV